MKKLYTPEMIEYLKEISHHRFNDEITKLFNEHFDTTFTENQIQYCRYRYGIKSGIDATFKKGMRFSKSTEFKKGHVSHNKGKKGWCAPGSEKGWFKKGNRPHQYLPVGTEIMKTDGYVYIKIADPNKWKQKHRIIWEDVNGPYDSKTHVLIFKDGNRQNCSIDNLELITRRELAILNKNNLLSQDKELTETGLLVAKIIEARSRRKKSEK